MEHWTSPCGTVTLTCGDCLEVARELAAADVRFASVITDSPYGLTGSKGSKRGFMGRAWDAKTPGAEFWEAFLAITSPGGHLLAFGGTRTYHRQTCAIEDAGWIIRDCLMWLYGSGFPKSLQIDKAIDKALGAEREVVGVEGRWNEPSGIDNAGRDRTWIERKITRASSPESERWEGWGTALAPAYEPITLAMAPRDGTFANNALEHGVAGLWIDGARIGMAAGDGWDVPARAPAQNRARTGAANGTSTVGRDPSGARETPHNKGRWPANIILDEAAAQMLDDSVGERVSGHIRAGVHPSGIGYSGCTPGPRREFLPSTGGPSRFFYTSKASASEREAGLSGLAPKTRTDVTGRQEGSRGQDNPRAGSRRRGPIRNTHATVKALDLMRWLCRLTKQPDGGTVFDPFMGSGTTGVAAVLEGRPFVGVEMRREAFEIAKRRISHALRGVGVDVPRPEGDAPIEGQLDIWGRES